MANPQALIKLPSDDIKVLSIVGEDAYEHKITLKGLQLFKCSFMDFREHQMIKVRKRNVIMPFSFFFGIKNELHITKSRSPIVYFQNKFQLSFDKTVLKFSYKDLIVFMGIAEFFKNQIKLI